MSNLRPGYNPPPAELNPGSAVCQCTDCEEYFTAYSPFDLHLIRNTRNPHIPPRCMTPAEMIDKGMRQNIHGVWGK